MTRSAEGLRPRNTLQSTRDVPEKVSFDFSFIVSVVVIAIAACLSQVAGLTNSLWRDEVATASAADRSWGDLLHLLSSTDAGVAGYYGWMFTWTSVFGHSEFSLRIPSLVSAAAVIVVGGVLTRNLRGRVAGYAAAVFLALHPYFLPIFSTEARPYALAAALVGMAALVAHHGSLDPNGRTWTVWLWSLIACLAISMQLLACLAVAAQAAWFLKHARIRPLIVASAVGVPAIVALAMGWAVSRQLILQSWIPAPTFASAEAILMDLMTPLAVAGITVLTFLAVSALRPSRIRADRTLKKLDLAILVGWSLGPYLVLLIWSLAIEPVIVERYVIFSVVGVSCLFGAIVATAFEATRSPESGMSRTRYLSIMLVGLVLLGGALANLFEGALQPAEKPESLRDAATWITDRQLGGDGVIYAPTWAESGMRWYLSDSDGVSSPPDLTADQDETAISAGSLWTPTAPGRSVSSPSVRFAKRIFVVGYQSQNPWEPISDVGTSIAASIRTCSELAEKAYFGGIYVELWVKIEDACPSGGTGWPG